MFKIEHIIKNSNFYELEFYIMCLTNFPLNIQFYDFVKN